MFAIPPAGRYKREQYDIRIHFSYITLDISIKTYNLVQGVVGSVKDRMQGVVGFCQGSYAVFIR